MLGVPAPNRSINDVTGLADDGETTGEFGKLHCLLKNQKVAGRKYQVMHLLPEVPVFLVPCFHEKVAMVGHVWHAHSCPLPLSDSQEKVVFFLSSM